MTDKMSASFAISLRNSSAAISCLCFGDEALWQDFRAVFTAGPLRNHTPMQVSRFVAGLEQVPPGLAAARNGRPGWNEVPGKPPGPVCVLAGVARKP